ncbi:ATPase AAA [Anopheles sinensis]|uniref:ATPase AAA n=1 Tax=Anopheles sinensis TaxID=74873 RepID=A0A084VU31_ANOSI|nr:ATPase AAA [Anopheles sinensis]
MIYIFLPRCLCAVPFFPLRLKTPHCSVLQQQVNKQHRRPCVKPLTSTHSVYEPAGPVNQLPSRGPNATLHSSASPPEKGTNEVICGREGVRVVRKGGSKNLPTGTEAPTRHQKYISVAVSVSIVGSRFFLPVAKPSPVPGGTFRCCCNLSPVSAEEHLKDFRLASETSDGPRESSSQISPARAQQIYRSPVVLSGCLVGGPPVNRNRPPTK